MDPGDEEPSTPTPQTASTEQRAGADDLDVLTRREVEARIVAPLLERLAAEYGEGVYEVAAAAIVEVARSQGAELAARLDANGLADFAAGLGAWSQGGALESELIELSDEVFAFDVTRCRYAEMYRALGLGDLGALLSCNRDASLIAGFNPEVRFSRTRTIMAGDDRCDFRFTLPPTPVEISPRP